MAHKTRSAMNAQKPTQVKVAIVLLCAYIIISILIETAISISIGDVYISAPELITYIASIASIFIISKGNGWPRILLGLLYLGVFVEICTSQLGIVISISTWP
jgi:hypothetical protein